MRKKEDEESKSTRARPPRVIVPDLAAYRDSSEEVLLRTEEAAHVRTRRLRDGEDVVALDGRGLRARARLSRKGTALASVVFEDSTSSGPGPGEPLLRVTVLLACAEPARIEWAVEKGTECGAAAFALLVAERSQRTHVAALRARLPRLLRIAEEATKQCDRTVVPEISGTRTPEDFLRRWTGLVLLAQPGAPELARAVMPQSGRAALAIGPEGGFSPSEVLLFEESGARLFSLGPRILRLETAVVAALTLLVGSPDR